MSRKYQQCSQSPLETEDNQASKMTVLISTKFQNRSGANGPMAKEEGVLFPRTHILPVKS